MMITYAISNHKPFIEESIWLDGLPAQREITQSVEGLETIIILF